MMHQREALLFLGCILGFACPVLADELTPLPVAPDPLATWDQSLRVFTPPGRSATPSPPVLFDPPPAGLADGFGPAAGWPMRGNVPANTGLTAHLGPATVKAPAWTYEPAAGTSVWRPAVAPDGTIYVTTVRFPTGTVDGKLVALNPAGTIKWVVTLTDSGAQNVWTSATPVIDAAGNIYVAWAHNRDFKDVVCLSLDSSGNVRWRFEPRIEFEHASHQQPVLANGVVYAALDTSFQIGNPTHRGSIFAIDPADGKPLWRWVSPNLDTFFEGPAIGPDGALYHASASNPLREAHGYLYRILPSGTLDWSRDIGAGVNATPAVDDQNNTYLGDLAGVAFKYASDGTRLWTYDTQSGRIYTSPVLSAGRVLIGAADAGLHVLDAASGTKLDVFAPAYYPMGSAADRAGNVFFYCYHYTGPVFGFGLKGRELWTFTTGAGVSVNASIVAEDGTVLVSNSKKLVAYVGTTLGDLNCDGRLDFDDIDAFVLALSGQAAYYAVYPDCNWLNADCDGDGEVNFDDIDPFVALLAAG